LTAIKSKLIEKRKLHKLWQIDIDSANLALKTKLNRIIKALRNLLELERNEKIQKYLNKLSITVAINYSGKPSRDYPQTQYPHIIPLGSKKRVGPEVMKKRPKYLQYTSPKSLSITRERLI